MISGIALSNALRVVVLGLFGLTLGETAIVFKNYSKVIKSTRRLLPMHIAGVSAGLMMLEFYVAFTTVTVGIGRPFSWLILYNIAALGLVYASLVMVRRHVGHKKKAHEEIASLLDEPDFTP